MGENRYARQTILAEVGRVGQWALGQARVLCVGAGGLGSPVLLYLAAAGVGTIGVIDGDQVDATNLQRQILFQDDEVGVSKAEAAKKRLRAQNPELKCESYVFDLGPGNAREIISQYDLVIDGTDNFDAKYLINDVCTALEKPWVFGAVNRFDGQVSAFHAKHGPCYRCLYSVPPLAATGNCAENGVLGATVGIVGSWQALIALQILLPQAKPRWGSLQIVNALNGEQMMVQITKNPKCPTCSRKPGEIMIKHDNAKADVQKLTAAEVLKKRNKFMAIDVRTPEEFKSGHIAGSVNWPLDRIEKGNLPKESIADAGAEGQKILLYCQGGKRSAMAAALFRQAGYGEVVELKGGILEWSAPLA